MAAASPPLNSSNRLFMDPRDHPPPNPATEDKERMEQCYEDDPHHFKIVAGACFRGHTPYTPPDRPTYAFLEVFSLIINDITGPPHIYGKIVIDGGFGRILLFHRGRPSRLELRYFEPSEEDISFVNEDGQKELLLNGPTKESMLPLAPFHIEMRFMNNIIRKPCEHMFRFEPSRTKSSIYDTLLSATLEDEAFGSVTLNYAVFANPLVAKVEVVLLKSGDEDGDGEGNTYPVARHVVGQIYAKNSFYKNKSMLFYKTTPDDMIVDLGGMLIPLSKSIVSLPTEAELEIGLNLKDSNTDLSIVNDVAFFRRPPELCITPRSWEKISDFQIFGDIIRVTVTWSQTKSF